MRSKILAAALILAGCGPGPSASAPQAVIWARSADSTTLDPAEVESVEDMKVTQSLYEGLVAFKEGSTELEGRLATSWSFSPDGRAATFELRPGMRFHDGTPVDAQAVVFSFQRVLEPSAPQRPRSVPYAASFSVIEKVAAGGPEKVVFTLRAPSAVFLPLLTLPGATVVSPSAVRKFGDKFPQNPCGTGPYRLAQWDRDVRIVLDAFPEYWGRKPAVARVIVVPIVSPQAAILKLRKGELQVVDHPSLADVKALQDDPATHVGIERAMNVCYLGFNVKKPPGNNPDFRRAVSLALDRRKLNSLAYYDLAEPATNLIPPAIWGGIAPTPEYECDLRKARECVERMNLGSKEVELVHMTYPRPYMPDPARVAEFVKDQLRQIGLEVRLTGYDKSAYTAKIKEEGHPMFLYGWLADYADPDNFYYPLLHGDNSGDLNGAFFSDPAFNGAVKAAQTELDPAKRRSLYASAYARYREELPTIPLVHARQVVALSKGVDYKLHPIECRFYDLRRQSALGNRQ